MAYDRLWAERWKCGRLAKWLTPILRRYAQGLDCQRYLLAFGQLGTKSGVGDQRTREFKKKQRVAGRDSIGGPEYATYIARKVYKSSRVPADICARTADASSTTPGRSRIPAEAASCPTSIRTDKGRKPSLGARPQPAISLLRRKSH